MSYGKGKIWTKNFFFCHEDDSCYSHEFIVSPGFFAKVRFFSDDGGEYFIAPEEGVSDCPCGPRKQWFPAKTVACDFVNDEGQICTEQRPHVLVVNHCDDYLELEPGNYRFCAMDCSYMPVVPGSSDILLRVQHCVDNRPVARQKLTNC